MIDKIENFIREHKLKECIFKYNGILFNETNWYPENYYMFEENLLYGYFYDVCRDNKRLRYKGSKNIAFTLFLIKALFIKYSKVKELDAVVYIQEQSNIEIKGNRIYYQNSIYDDIRDIKDLDAAINRLNRRACHLTMFINDLIEAGIIKKAIPNKELFELMELK